MTFRNSLEYNIMNEDITEYNEYYTAIIILETYGTSLNEGILDNITGAVKKKIQFIKDVTKYMKGELKILLKLFKDSRFFKIFKVIGFSISKIVDLYKTGVKTYNNIEKIISKKIQELGGVKYIKKNLHILDDFFNEHPILKKLGGIAVAGLLFYIWTQMSFTPNLEYSMDFKDMILALQGKFSLAELFATDSGITMLIYFATGAILGIGMPWPGKQIHHIIGGLVWSAYKLIKPKDVKLSIPKK